MNPLRISRILREDYLTLLRTTFRPRQPGLREAFDREIEQDGFLAREPFVSLAQPYQYGTAIDWLCEDASRRLGAISERPYLHQAQAARRIANGQPVVVATGTGSGKTESFLIPIVDWCLRHRSEPGLKAILMYPMNALATDQLRRVRALLGGTGVSFGRYTGETQLSGQRQPDAPEEERVTRNEFRGQPPHILLTNYQMLEYMLLRGDGRDIFRGHQVRFVVLDEVHTYHGVLGTDVACLLRRLRASLAGNDKPHQPPLFIGTSATLQSDVDGTDPREGVARFFTRLTGQETTSDAVITESLDAPAVPDGMSLPTSPQISDEELAGFTPGDSAAVLGLARRLAGTTEADNLPLGQLWDRVKLAHLLLSWLRSPTPVSGIIDRLGAEPERQGIPESAIRSEIEAALLVGPYVGEEHPLRLRPRVHRFLRGLARFWRCTNPDCGRLVNESVESCTSCGSRTLPLALCRTCGWDFFMAREREGRAFPWTERTSTNDTTYYYDSPVEHIETDTEDNPFEPGDEPPETAETIEQPEDEDAEAPCEAEKYICPGCLGIYASPYERNCTCGNEHPLRAVRVHQRRGTRCPVCNSRYGRFDVITPVSMGNSSALTHVSRTLLRELPEENRKILIFCDSRQDAAHQARFIDGVEGHLRMRRAIYRLLGSSDHSHDLPWLMENIYHDFVERGFLPRTRSRDARRREMDKIEGGLLSEFVLAANVRLSLERLGLVQVHYSGLDEELRNGPFLALCEAHGLDVHAARLSVRRLLDLFRSKFAVSHEVFRTRLYRNDRLSLRYGLTPGRQVGLPVAFQRPGNRSESTVTYKLLSTWNLTGPPAAVQRLWRQLLGDTASLDSLVAVLDWLEEQEWIAWVSVGREARETEGYQIVHDVLEFHRSGQFVRCNVCGRTIPGELPGHPCSRAGCDGLLASWDGPLVEGNLNALLIAAEYAPSLRPAEHSAAVGDDRRQEIERGFQINPPDYNVLVCTPTLELGVNIGDLEAISMRNVPPSPANYAQRAGRTGRRSRMGLAVSFARNTPHDGYFFDHPDEVITGSIPPPRFNLNNLEAIARHIRSLVLEEARLDFPSNLETLITEIGAVNARNLQNLLNQVNERIENAAGRAREVFGSQLAEVRPDWEQWLGNMIQQVPGQIQNAIERRAALIEDAVRRMRELANEVRQTQRQQDAEQGFRNLARKLREDYRYAYLPRVFAEMGMLPGYSFPGDPGSLSLGYDPDPVFTGRVQAQREFAPGQIVYARGNRWRVTGIALNRPGSRTQGSERFEFTECTACGLAAPASGPNNCPRCGTELGGPDRTAWDAGAFQACLAEVEPETEEERQSVVFDIRVHPQRDVAAQRFSLGPWEFELRRQEEIWWINHGPFGRSEQDQNPESSGFRLCPVCGELRPEQLPPQRDQGRRGRRNRDARAVRDPHAERCGGQPASVAIGHQARADTLRLIVPGLRETGSDGVAWAWSMAWAVVRGAIHLFDLDEDDLEARVLTHRGDASLEVIEIVWVDSVLGGSGILGELVQHFPMVARSALQHLQDHDCPSSCYRCLRTHRNQRVHGLLDWRLIAPQLRAVSLDHVTTLASGHASGQAATGPDWEEARREGCGSPLELRLLRAMREAGLEEPEKQFPVRTGSGQLLTVADFAFPQQRLLVYVDGLAFHSSLRQRIHDISQTNQLQNMRYTVLRFIGPQVLSRLNQCIDQIRHATEMLH